MSDGAGTMLWLRGHFPATHRIRIGGELEPVHGHDFVAEVEIESTDPRDAATLIPDLAAVLAELAATDLAAVHVSQGGLPSAERIAVHVHGALARRLAADPSLRVRSATIHEALGCSARYDG